MSFDTKRSGCPYKIRCMKLSNMSVRKLRRALKATEKAVGPGSYEVQVLRKELNRRRDAGTKRQYEDRASDGK